MGAHAQPVDDHPGLRPLAAAGEAAYRFGSSLLRRIRSRRGGGADGVTIVSVGNLEVGGNGKTPFAIHLLEYLTRGARRPVYVSRAFKGVAENLEAVTVVLPAGHEISPPVAAQTRLIHRHTATLHVEIGDEGAMVAVRCPSVPLLFNRRRERAVDIARRMFKPTHIILDDAFQTWSVRRDVDAVLLDAAEPFGNGKLLPAGRLREAPDALARADVIGLNGYTDGIDLDAFAERVRTLCGRRVPVFGVYRRVVVRDAATGEAVTERRQAAACLSSIARPASLERGLLAMGVDLRLAIRYPDHYRYTARDVERIGRLTGDRGINRLITTEKDWAKLSECPPAVPEIVLARLDLELTDEAVLAQIEKPQAVPAASQSSLQQS